MESPQPAAASAPEEHQEGTPVVSSSSSGAGVRTSEAGAAATATPAASSKEGRAAAEEQEEKKEKGDQEEHWKAKLLRYCRELDVAGLRQLLPRLSPDEVCAGLNETQYNWQAQATALTEVLAHLGEERLRDSKAPVIENSAGLATEAVRLLLEARADPNSKDIQQHWPMRKPLAQCTSAGAVESARMLLEAKASLELDRMERHRHGTVGVLWQVVPRAHMAVLDVVMESALGQGDVGRDLLHAASRRGCQLASERLDASGLSAERTLQDSGDMPMLTFSFDHIVWHSSSSGGDAPKVILAPGDLARWPCEAMLCDVSRDAAGQAQGLLEASASSSGPPTAVDQLIAVQPELRQRLQARDKFEYHIGRVFSMPAEGSLPMIYILCTCLDPSPCKALYTRGVEQSDDARAPGVPCGCTGTEEVLLKAFLRAFKFAQEHHCPRLAVPPLSTGPGGFYTPEESARILLNALLIHFRSNHKPEGHPLREISIVVSRREDYDAYRTVLARLSASGERLRFFRDLGAGLRDNACPQPSRKAPVNRLEEAVLSEESAPARRKRDLAVPVHAAGFAVEGLLSADECRSIIDAAESAGLESVGWEYVPSYRDCRRAIFHDARTAARIWRRLAPLLRRDDLHELRPIGWDTEGVWAPRGLNECLRVSRYDCGGKFAMHRDGPFVVSQDTRSIFTVLVYLNENFAGGSTAFEFECDGKACLDAFQPATGSALVFTHDARHEGRVVTGGSKYVLRTDIMFHRVDNLGLNQQGILGLEDPLYRQCEALYRESIRLQNDGDPEGSTERYLEALEMQAQLASVRRRREGSNGALPDAVWALVFRLLDVREAVECAALGRRARRLTLDGEAWRERYAQRWAAAPRTSAAMASWYSLFKYRCAADECWRAACFEVGFRVTRYAMLGNQPALKLRTMDPYADHLREAHGQGQPAALVGGLYSAISQIRGHYWGAHSGFKNYYVGKEALKPPFRGDVTGLRGAFEKNADRSPDVEVFLELMRWTFAFGFEEPCWPLKHPLLLAVPPHLKAETRAELAESLDRLVVAGLNPDDAYNYRYNEAPQYSVPYLLLESASSLALQAAGQATGLHVHLAELCSVAAVVDGAAMDPTVFPMPTGMALDQSAMDAVWVAAGQDPRGRESARAVVEEARATSQGMSLSQQESLHRLVAEAARGALAAAGLAGAAPAPTVVVTADGAVNKGNWNALQLVDGVRTALASAGLLPVAVDPACAVVQGAVLRASTPDGRSRFRSAEGTPPPPPAPGLCRH